MNLMIRTSSDVAGARLAITAMAAAMMGLLVTLGVMAPSALAREPGQLTVGVLLDLPPHYSATRRGTPSGFAVEVMDAVAERANLQLNYRTYSTWPQMFEALRSGEVDVLPDTGITERRREEFAFTAPTDTVAVSIFVRRSSSNKVKGLADLPPGSTATVEGDVAVRLLEQTFGVPPRVFRLLDEALFALLASEVNALVYPEPWVLSRARQAGVDHLITSVGEPVVEIQRALAVRVDDTVLLQALDTALRDLLGSDDFRRMYQRWFRPPEPYWTTRRVVGATVLAALVVLLAAIGWRHHGLLRLQRMLLATRVERERAQQRLRSSERRYGELLGMAHEGIWTIDKGGVTTYANRAIGQILGYDPARMVGRHLSSFMEPDAAETLRKYLERRRESALEPQELDLRHESGRTIYALIVTAPIQDEQGGYCGCVLGVMDISERRHVQANIARLERQMRLLLESTSDGILSVDRDLRCTFANAAALATLGYTADELQGQDVHALLQPRREDGTPMARSESLILRSIIEDRTFASADEVLWTKSGGPVPVQYSSNPITEDGVTVGASVVFRDIAETRAMMRRMDFMARYDTLTELPNRREFETCAQAAIEDAATREVEHVIAYLDLDQFKMVNDTCGHAAGDAMLRQVTALMRDQVRHQDTLARLGGDEFGLLLKECSRAQALRVLTVLRDAVRDFRFVWEEKSFKIGVSIGATVISTQTPSLAVALVEADTACYLGKQRGGNRVQFHGTDDAALSRHHRDTGLVVRLQDALEHHRFELVGQLIAPLGNPGEQGLHFEFLLRLNDPQEGIMHPSDFLPAAERFRLMPAIDRWVVEAALTWLEHHRAYLGGLALCSINLSGASLNDEQFMSYLVSRLRDSNVPSTKLGFEITETVAVSHFREVAQLMTPLRELGVRFALDDFGSGMSSFGYLKQLPVDFLKIDGGLVRSVVRDPMALAMVEAVVRVGHVAGTQTIAEFAEAPAVVEVLTRIGVDYAQGHAVEEVISLEQMGSRLRMSQPRPVIRAAMKRLH